MLRRNFHIFPTLCADMGFTLPWRRRLVVDQVCKSKVGPLGVPEFLSSALDGLVVLSRPHIRIHLAADGLLIRLTFPTGH